MTRRCLALDAETGKSIAVPLRTVTGIEYTVTRIRVALLTVRGFWPSNTLLGVPIREWVENPATPDVEIEGWIRLLLSDIPGVVEVLAVDASRTDGDLSVSVRLRLTDISTSTAEADVIAQVGDVDDPRTPGSWFLLIPVEPVVY